MQILFIHGRDQQDFTQEELLSKWTEALVKAFANAEMLYPDNLVINLPYYGKELIVQRDIYIKDVKSGKYQMKSTDHPDHFLELQSELLDDLRKNAGITEKQIHDEMKAEIQERDVQNFPAFLAIARLFDNLSNEGANKCILRKTNDVVTYLIVPEAKVKVNKYFSDALTNEPTLIIAHSLGTVIAYDLLHKLKKDDCDIRGLITMGSPLGIKAIIRQLFPSPTFPSILKGPWINIYDKHDIVSLRPLKGGHFHVSPDIINIEVDNNTVNKHGIEGYLNSEHVAKAIVQILNGRE